MISRGDIHWVDLGEPNASRPAKRRPVLVIQAASYNNSRLATAIVAVITSNTGLAALPGNVFLPAAATGLARDSVVNITALATLNKDELGKPVATVPESQMIDVDQGMRRVLGL